MAMARHSETIVRRNCGFLAVWMPGRILCGIRPYVPMIYSKAHNRSQEACVSAPRSIHFVDVAFVDRGFGDGQVETGE